MKRKLSKHRYFLTWVLVTLVFLIGLFLGQWIAEWKMEEFAQEEKEFRNYLFGLELLPEILAESLCEADVFALTEKKVEMGRLLTELEARLGKDNPDVISLKKDYTLLSLKQWLLVKRIKEECGKNLTIILFFYSNKQNASLSEAQGYVLDYLYLKYPNTLVTYALDTDLDLPVLDVVKEVYGIRQVPSLVINEVTYPGFQPKQKLESLLLS